VPIGPVPEHRPAQGAAEASGLAFWINFCILHCYGPQETILSTDYDGIRAHRRVDIHRPVTFLVPAIGVILKQPTTLTWFSPLAETDMHVVSAIPVPTRIHRLRRDLEAGCYPDVIATFLLIVPFVASSSLALCIGCIWLLLVKLWAGQRSAKSTLMIETLCATINRARKAGGTFDLLVINKTIASFVHTISIFENLRVVCIAQTQFAFGLD